MPENDAGLEQAPADIPSASTVIEQIIASTAEHLEGKDDTFMELLKAHILVLDENNLDAEKMLVELKDLADHCASDEMEPVDGDH